MDVVAEQYSVIIRGMANVTVLAWSIARIRSEDSLSALFTVLPVKKLPIRTLMTWFVLLSVICAIAMDGLLARILYREQYFFEWDGQQNTTVIPIDIASPTITHLPSVANTSFGPLLVSKPISSWEGSDTILEKAAWLLWALSLSFGLAPLIMLSSFWSAHIKELFHETNLITTLEFRTYFVYGFFSFLIGPVVYIVIGFVLGWNSATYIARLFFFSEGLLVIVLHIITLGRLIQLRRDSKLGGNRTIMTEKLGYFIDLDFKLLIAMIGIILPLFLMLMVQLPYLSIPAERFIQEVLISIVTLSYVGYPAVLMLILYPRKVMWGGDISNDVLLEADDKIYGMQALPSQRPDHRYGSISEIVEAGNSASVSGPSGKMPEKHRTSTFSTTVGNAFGIEDSEGLQIYSSKRRSKGRSSEGPAQRSSGTSMKERFSGSRLASFVSQQKNNSRPSDETEGSPLTMPPHPSTPSSPAQSQFVAESPIGSPLRQRNGSMSVYQPMLWSPVPFDYIPTDSMSTIQSLPPVVTRGGVTSPRARNNNPYSSPYSPRASSDLGSISESTDSRRISTTSTDQYLNRILGGQRPNAAIRKRDIEGPDPYLSAIIENRDSPSDVPVADEYLNNILGINVNRSVSRPTTGPAASALTAMNTCNTVESRQQAQENQQQKEEKQLDSTDNADPYLTHIRSGSLQDIITDVRAEIGSLRRSVGISASTPTESNPLLSDNRSARHSNLGRASFASGVTESSLGFDTNNVAEWIHEYAGEGFDMDEFKEEMRVAQRNTTHTKSERRDSDMSWVPPESKDDPLQSLYWEETSSNKSRGQSAQSKKRGDDIIGSVPPSRSNRGSKTSTPAHTLRGVTPINNSREPSSGSNSSPGSEESFSRPNVQRPSELAKSSQRWSKAAKGYPFPEPESYRNNSPSQQSIQSAPEPISRMAGQETSYSSQRETRYSLSPSPASNNTYDLSSHELPSPLVSEFDDFDGYGSSYPEEFQYDEDEEDVYRQSEGHVAYAPSSSSIKSLGRASEPASYPPPNPQALSSLPPPRRPYRNPLRALSGSPTSEPIVILPEIATATPRDTFGETNRRSYYDDDEPLSPTSAASEDTVRARSGPRIMVHSDDGGVTDFNESRRSNGSIYADDMDFDSSSTKRQSAFGDFGVRR